MRLCLISCSLAGYPPCAVPSIGAMLVLFETAAGFALFKVLQEGKLKEATDLWQDFSSLEAAESVRVDGRG